MGVFDLVSNSARQASTLGETEHRPWPLPKEPWLVAQTWDDVLFAHWRVAPDAVRMLLPDRLELELHDGNAWLGVTLLRAVGQRVRGTLPLPLVSSFGALSVQTYVTAEGRSGVWCFSLDAASAIAARSARRVYKLPAFGAQIALARGGGRILYECVRNERKAFSGSYCGTGAAAAARRGSVEEFLVERYCIYAEDRGRLLRAELHHRPWQLQSADARVDLNTMPPDELELRGAPVVHYSARQDAVIWPLREVAPA
jgi:hypothetical protein